MTLTQSNEIYIYGGSFNPPTIAHRAVVESCIEQEDCLELWLLPSGERLDKQIQVDKNHRIKLLEFMIGNIVCDKKIIIEKAELFSENITQTFRTVKNLSIQYPDYSFRYIFGSDSYNSMPDWQDGIFLQQNLPMLIIPRDGSIIKPAQNIKILDHEIPENISSSKVRSNVFNSIPIDHLVDLNVDNYIRNNQLYVQ